MDILEFFGLFGGLALFLHGMQMMSSGLEAAAGNRMKTILERLTANRFMGILVGALITAAVQSSSATTVMVVGFVNAGIMNLNQAVWLIMGANVGKTTTGLLIALDVGALAPIVAFAGVFMMIFLKKPNLQHIGQLLAGLGILFIGMDMMSAAMEPLREVPAFVNMMATLSNPILGILFGTVFTALIQSSAASVGILQTLAAAGVVQFSSSVYILFGQNIGTCITAVLASIGANRDAKRTTLIHLMFNIIGTTVFTIVCIMIPFTSWVAAFTPSNPAAQIANVHTLFNLVTTLLLLPFGSQLARLSEKLLPDRPGKPADEEHWFEELLASEHVLGVSVIARKQLMEEVSQMLSLAAKNVDKGFLAFREKSADELEQILKREEEIDLSNARLSRRISKVLTVEHNPAEVDALRRIFTISGNVERIGDHAKNIAGYARTMMDRGLELSAQAQEELADMRASSMRAINLVCSAKNLAASSLGTQALPADKTLPLNQAQSQEYVSLLEQAALLEQEIDEKTLLYRSNQIDRMGNGKCHVETSILYSEILTDYERIGDHVFNIARALAKLGEEKDHAS